MSWSCWPFNFFSCLLYPDESYFHLFNYSDFSISFSTSELSLNFIKCFIPPSSPDSQLLPRLKQYHAFAWTIEATAKPKALSLDLLSPHLPMTQLPVIFKMPIHFAESSVLLITQNLSLCTWREKRPSIIWFLSKSPSLPPTTLLLKLYSPAMWIHLAFHGGRIHTCTVHLWL